MNEEFQLNNSEVLIDVPPLVWKEHEIIETENLYRSWGLSDSACLLLKVYGINSIDILEKMELEDISDFFDKIDNCYYGDRIKFKSGLRQWRKDRDKPLICDADTLSQPSTRKVLEWLEKISNHLSKSNSSMGTSITTSNSHISSSQEYDLGSLLKSTIKGQLILQYYQKNSYLDSKKQKDLTHCIVDHFVTKNIKMSYGDMRGWANAIVSDFPTEKVETYFLPRKPDKKNPTGKLFSRWSNIDHASSFPEGDEVQQIKEPEEYEITHEQFCEKKCWLKNNCTPWETVRIYWKETSKQRVSEFQSEKSLLLSILLQQWPRFNDAAGYELIDMDFEAIYPGKGNYLAIKYEDFFSKILLVLEEEIKDKSSKEMLKYLYREDISKDSKDCITSLLLHSILQPVRFKKTYKPTIADAQADFVVHIKNINNLMPELEKIRLEFKNRKETLQPRIVVVGPEIYDLKDLYVFCDGIKYKCCTYIKCIEIIIKLCYVYKIEYSQRSKLVWVFLEQYFFEINSEKFSSISNLISKLNFK